MNIGILIGKPLVCEHLIRSISCYKNDKFLDIELLRFNSGEELLRYNEDLFMVIISLEIPGGNGYEIANLLKKNNPNILLVLHAENSRNIQRSAEFGAFRYICNQISKEKLYSCLDDALERVKDKCFIVKNDNDKVVIKLKDIVYIEAGTKGSVVRNTNAILQ